MNAHLILQSKLTFLNGNIFMITNHFRRRFFKIAASAVLWPLSVGAESLASLKPKSLQRDAFRFVDVSGLGPEQTGEYVENSYCPIHKEKSIMAQAISAQCLEDSRNMLMQEFKKNNIPWKSSYDIVWTSQHYGVADTSGIATDLLFHCRMMHEYLYSNIDQLSDIKINWEYFPAAGKCSHVGLANFSAYVGRYTYSVIRVHVADENRQYKGPYSIYSLPLERSLNYISSTGEDYKANQSTIYIIPGLTSLISPVSELLHISTTGPSLAYVRQLEILCDPIEAQQLARQFTETIIEAISITLVNQYLHTLELSNRVNQLVTLAQYISEYLPLLSNALSFCREQGVQECFNAFQENPELLKQRIEVYL